MRIVHPGQSLNRPPRLTSDGMTLIIDGKRIAAEVKDELVDRIAALKQGGVVPGLAVIIVGENPASRSYVRMKGRMCADLGLNSWTHELPASISEEDLLDMIDRLNRDPAVHGILCQLPVPDHIDENKVISAIDPEKDVDGFHPVSMGRILIGDPGFRPATPAGIQELLVRSGIETSGKHVVVVGRSNIVGKPIAAMLVQKASGANATVTICHSRTRDLPSFTRQADILIAAIGRPHFITADMVKEGAVVIDVGTNRVDDPTAKRGYRLTGDVDFDAVKGRCKAITPSPGGVGPMTIIMLMSNTVLAAERARSK